jgi:hypothetical protein
MHSEPLAKRLVVRSIKRLEDNIKMDVRETDCVV